jgi:hypothetical protein
LVGWLLVVGWLVAGGWLVGCWWLVAGGHLPYKIIFKEICIVIALVIVMLLRDFGPYGIRSSMAYCVD